ncbi:hypothetical protein Ciccas_006864 [Cichlidogyrus casuarinus]|uniref:Uncharacterized protein n=1 Tax=Cichlidogyrus casuarinus TaxID=1844966 RepID=A0ABD2Q4R2_9PLAT
MLRVILERVSALKLYQKRRKADLEKGLWLVRNTNPRKFWAHCRLKSSKPSTALKVGGRLLHFAKDLADALADQFVSTYVKEFLYVSVAETVVPEASFAFTHEMISDAIRKLKRSYVDYNGVPTLILKLLSAHITSPLSDLFNSYLAFFQVTQEFCRGTVYPEHKKGSLLDPTNPLPRAARC